MDVVDAVLLEAHCNLIIRRGIREAEMETLECYMGEMFDKDGDD